MRKTLLLAVRCYAIVKIASVTASASSTVASTAFSGITPKKRVKAFYIFSLTDLKLELHQKIFL